MKVKNVSGSSRFPKPAGFDSWLDYWEYHSKKALIFVQHQDVLEKI